MAIILIIDDHALFRTGLSEVLKMNLNAVQILESGSVRDALSLDSDVPALIILDIMLNGLNGLDGMSLLKKKWPNVPILILSSDGSSLTQQSAMQRGAMAYLHKGSATDKIITIIQRALKGEIVIEALLSFDRNLHINGLKASPPDHLTARQIEVLDLLCTGLSNKLIARKLCCSDNTVRGHVQAILQFLQVSTRSEAMYAARQQGLVA
ncbi:MAG: response regulator transcription factor [Undibacterium sp.]|nr:response regulator transcription factor [Undibacterium sp.]